ncbi:anthrone oxygenase family protein [Actinokineospora xionganensis]|uniref:DUF1772 domain-containing protein n=1 Tax=Actinokineospora xionganensis TaxID=2684470 RepID=A0ABR7L6M3_9PSEU|nr:anthrone oxygenase family protein [Actinokineospora xionganensis]MBC6448163.1 DUF1772 domain-containing protein [Actinokineospora xionganensis]
MSQVVLVLATVTSGLIAGLFFAFACSVMLGLGGVEDRVFVDVMRRINRSIQNGLFGLVFMGSLLSSGAVIVIDLVDGGGLDARAVAGAALFLLSLLITFAVNIPLNNRLDAADPADIGQARKAFEAPWVRWNQVRMVAATAGFVLLCLAVQN